MGTLNDYYTAAAAVPPPDRRWVVGAGYALYEKVQLFGYPLATARASILSLPQYADALTRTGLSATFSAVDTFPGGGGPALSAPTFVGTGTTPAGGSGSLSLTAALPAGVADNDIGLVLVAVHDTTSVVTMDAAWTTAVSLTGAVGQFVVAWRRLLATDGGPVVTRATPTGAMMVNASVFRGVRSAGNPWAVAPSSVDNVSAATVTAPGVTTTSANNLVVMLAAHWTDITSTAELSGWATANLGAMTEILDSANLAANGVGVGAATVVAASAGATGAGTATLVTAGPSMASLVALTPG
jgi:hypothetical protein